MVPVEPVGHVPGFGMGLVGWLASPRWMLAFFLFALASAFAALREPGWTTAVWVPPLVIFAVSLTAAILTNPRFRRDVPLLGLHLGLLVFVLLLLFARLTYLEGAITLDKGAVFNGVLQIDRRGPLHAGGIERLRFANEGFIEDYTRSEQWRATENRVRWWDDEGGSHVARIGDGHPLTLSGYRIYPTFNRGYAPVFRWRSKSGMEEMGSVQLRAGRFDMANAWHLPGGPEIWAMLKTEKPLELRRGEIRENLGEAELSHVLVLRVDGRREELAPGQAIELPQGTLTYLELGSWMGYKVVYDTGMYWMAASAVIVLLCMMVFYMRMFWRNGDEDR